ncbi:hypothetical protein KZ307_25530, partial [Escherichia coli]|uniref:hypothetical protein n=1 Tax=Escherichia coli TaxID=562 RepID=UPI001EDBF813
MSINLSHKDNLLVIFTSQNKPSQGATSAPTQEDNKCGTSLPIKSYLTTNHFRKVTHSADPLM